MGKDKKKEQQQQIASTAMSGYENTKTPSAMQSQFTSGVLPSFTNAYQNAVNTNTQDYSNIMGGYNNFLSNIPAPKNFSFQHVTAEHPKELDESYGYLREAAPGYRDFARTGGYSNQDIQELRARSTSPIRAAYGNTMMELDRARALGGGYSPGYTAAISRANRELPSQMADAQTNINAALADQIRQGKLAGLAGISGIGDTMGNLSSADANRMLQAALGNQNADIQAQSLSEQSLASRMGLRLAGLGGQANLYGTTPGMASTFGNQALQGWNSALGAENANRSAGIDYLNTASNATNAQANKGTPWWRKALGAAAAGAATYFSGGALAPAAGGIYGAVAGS